MITETQAMFTAQNVIGIETITGNINIDFIEWHPENTDSTSTLEITDSFGNVLWKIITETVNPIDYSNTILKQDLKKLSVRELNITMSSGILYIFKL